MFHNWIGVTTDILFPSKQQREITESLEATGTDVEYVEIDSVNGHDAFLIDDKHFSPVVKSIPQSKKEIKKKEKEKSPLLSLFEKMTDYDESELKLSSGTGF